MSGSAPFASLLEKVIDNRGKTCPVVDSGMPLIATNCVKNSTLYPTFEKIRFVSSDTYQTWFRGHPEPGDMIFVTKGSPGEVCWTPDPVGFCIAQDMVAIRADATKIYPRYLFAALRSPKVQHDIKNMHVGTLIPHFKKGDFDKLYIPLLDMPAQEAIGDLYFSLCDKIDLNRRMNETLEAMARALFKDWFVDFGPTRAKMAGREPYLAQEIWDLFPDKLDDDGKPEGWENFTLADLAHHHRATVSPSAEPEQTFEHYSIPAYDAGNEPTLDRGGSIKSNKTVVPENAVLLSKLNPEIERVWFPNPRSDLPQVSSTEFLAFTPLGDVTRALLFCMFKSRAFRTEMAAMVTGTSKSHQRVPPKPLFTREVLTANPRVLAAFDAIVRYLLDRLIANRSEARILAQTRDLLLPKLMSGEIRVGDAEQAVQEVV